MNPVTNHDVKMIELALSLATTSDYTKRVGAVLCQKGRVVATASNYIRNEGKHIPLSCRTIHAEEAVLRMVSESVANRSTLYIARIGKTRTDLLNSRPCDRRCMPALLEAGIKQIVYVFNCDLVKERI